MIRFSRYIWLYALISGVVLLAGLVSLFTQGFRQSIDFSGGTLFEVRFTPQVAQKQLEESASQKNLIFSSIQQSGTAYMLRTNGEDAQSVKQVIEDIQTKASVSATIVREETVGPVLGKELLQKALIAASIAIICILFYVAYAFKNVAFGVAAIIALIHDLLVVLGSFSLFGYFFGVEVDTLFVTAFLTTMSFSVHDTIVVFDRIREYQRKSSKFSFEEICDRALTETMNRSLTNSLTIIFMLIALVLLGGSTTQWFAIALLIGTVSGTYSSPFIATPALILISRWKKKEIKKGRTLAVRISHVESTPIRRVTSFGASW